MNGLPPRLLLLSSLLLALAAPREACAGEGACPAGMRYFGGGRYVLGDGTRTVSAPAFCLDVTEVTAAQFAECVDAGRCATGDFACSRAATYGDPERTAHPMNCVSWIEADGFCRRAGKRLPTEAEWEWAARGGVRAGAYPWGAAPPAARACWDGKGNALGKGNRKEPCPVGTHPEGDSPDGVSDLAGNVREWTSTSDGRFKVVRGGSWGDTLPEFLAVAFRGMNAPDERFELTGFRCAAEPLAGGMGSLARGSAAAPAPTSGAAAVPPVPVLQADELRFVVRPNR
jgi:sulfatase modifying factor 1